MHCNHLVGEMATYEDEESKEDSLWAVKLTETDESLLTGYMSGTWLTIDT